MVKKFLIFLTLIINILSKKKPNRYDVHLSDLEIKDDDPVVVKKNLIKKYFANKYKVYTFDNLKKFFYELKLGVVEIPDVRTLKSWKTHKKQTLEILDHFLDQHEEEDYTYKQIMKLIHDNHYSNFRSNRFKEIFQFVKTQHKEDLKAYNEKTFGDKIKNKDEDQDFFTSDL